MAEHRLLRCTRVRHALGSTRLRLLLCLGLVFAPGAVGTFAYWTDTATISGITITSGTLDLMVGDTATADELEGQGGTWNYAAFTMDAMLPGESIAKPVTIKNAGTTPLTYNGKLSSSNNDFAGNLSVSISAGATLGNSGSQAAGDRNGTCTGGSAWWTDKSVTAATPDMAPAAVTLAPGASTSLCVRAELDANAQNAVQGKSTVLTMLFAANQPS